MPRSVAIPWHRIATAQGRPAILSYATYALDNWRRLDPTAPVKLGNIALLQNFLGGIDEEWFIVVHVDIEAKASAAIAALPRAQASAEAGDVDGVTSQARIVRDSIRAMYATLLRMPDHCDPYIYYQRVRPYIHGWKDNPALPAGLIYDGVEAYGGEPQHFRGETGAQSSIVPSLDAFLGVAHKSDPLRPYLLEMRDYMPPAHRDFIGSIESGASVRDFVVAHSSGEPALTDVYNECLHTLGMFRSQHLEYAGRYIFLQHKKGPNNPTSVGTGGTPFMPYLRKHRDETTRHLIG